jgi:SAM-dependent methyltransferase
VTASHLSPVVPLHGRPGARRPAPRPGRAADVYGRALLSRLPGATATSTWRLRDTTDRVEDLDAELDRWLGSCGPADRSVLARCTGTTLDVGCGPGRFVAALTGAGVRTLGIDVSEVAVRLTRRRGGAAVLADVFGPVPSEGGWDGVLLLDGNVGIGGDPVHLVRRCAALLAPGGSLLVELGGRGRASGAVRLRLEGDIERGIEGGIEGGDARTQEAGPWFAWARLSVDDVARVAAAAGVRVAAVWSEEDRWFADLVR